ncbi:hypothetical protein KPH14_007482 [Odynerus spinipes]|uniref:Uncharacterized protein n=1 Tax=Odynerus spinipes TaxID=1348599 RepID=A0AAD9VJM3_9HYME|nr:hypothetical protein KPH14_007482 [Odynerus spinipes]
MKFLVFVFGVVAVECADAKLWRGDDRSNETFRIFLWIIYLKRLSLIAFMLLSVLLYYVPESRTHARKACFILIDSIAEGLKLVLRATEGDYENATKVKCQDKRYIEYVDKVTRKDGRSSQERCRIAKDEVFSRYQEGRRTSSRHRGQEGKYHHRRDRRRYLESYLEFAPVVRNRYRTCAVVTLNDAYPVRLKKQYDSVIGKADRREGIFYSKEEGVAGFEDDCAAIDSGISTNFYDSPSNRLDRKIADVVTYRREIVGDNEVFVNTNEGRSSMRQMQGDTIPEIPCNETSYTSVEAEADDENSQCENETMEMTFSNDREVETEKHMDNAKIDDVPAMTNLTGSSFFRAVKWIFGGCPGTCRHLSKLEEKQEENEIVGKEEMREKIAAVIDEWLCA